MEVPDMKLDLDNVVVKQGTWNLAAHGSFHEGIHLISGDIGSGKSTLALVMAGLFPSASGTVIRENVCSMMVSFQFPEYHITGATICEECASWGLDAKTILQSVSLTDKQDSDPFTLSRGELKRLHLACVMAQPYDLLILDEPFSSLDVCEKQRVCDLIPLHTKGITIIFTHEQGILPKVGHIWEIYEGQLMYCGTPPEGIRHWHHAPSIVRSLMTAGKTPNNISVEDLMEASCRI
jgi:energy-coupling factor transport system ATP-binding protein